MTAGVARTVAEGCHLGFPLDDACRRLMQSKREHKARLYFGGSRCASACVYAIKMGQQAIDRQNNDAGCDRLMVIGS
jgi:hypothetical protein